MGQEGGSGVQIIHGTRALHSFIKDWTSYAEGPQYELYEYVQPPLLIDGRRFSIGVFVLVTSIDPLIVWLYTEDYLVLVCLEAFKTRGEYDVPRNAFDQRGRAFQQPRDTRGRPIS